jgi:hypothetical protein
MHCQVLTGFAKQVREGYYGRGSTVCAGTVCTAIMAIWQTIALAHGESLTKTVGSEKFLPQLQQCIDGWRKQDLVSQKIQPVEADVQEYLVKCGLDPCGSELNKAIGNLSLIAFYYLLCIGEYTMKSKRENTKQTVQFKMEDVRVFGKDKWGRLQCLPRDALDLAIASTMGATLKLDNQKNGWKGVSMYHETNGDPVLCPVCALGQRYMHICNNGGKKKTFLSTYYEGGIEVHVTAEHIFHGLKIAAAALDYPSLKEIPIKKIDTHLLPNSRANALALSCFFDMQIQKMGCWKSATFKEYVHKELACFSTGMSSAVKIKFIFVNVTGTVFHNLIETAVFSECKTTISIIG